MSGGIKIQCTPWCVDGDGHPNESSRVDQHCFGTDNYVDLSLEEFDQDSFGTYSSRLGVTPSRGSNQLPTAYMHLDLIHRELGNLDRAVHLTAAEARALAAALLTVADTIEVA
ncbi:hypothetical protein CH260_10390 [Rhodococcus sp. 05-2256-B2]|uniref:DUF6907 domain-containing protein n=1 Tax=unclassified Rhodococcus (in: high G+C Gram-positive bacteria) TaxID=192944 RepID=UPI000B9A8616|nr:MULTISPECIES: hypothetical protein [unclassified Rhodococcus (in: high G+C Gram-positive bacteria)]OZD81815.1 hypothetical protein CH258_19790 [Rhodococcus sp. 05-2256-B4]OZD90436.1 hypothetical protein CH257_18185 [Rhodococcus sp. 05-2256-B3]OZD96940.1 hypothetical protein CH260_10390 [Rhodococcus sp. 05-2256-B2]OZE00438.1 hypothetical protein CH285_19435 [Rhodococcus sp. 05-2256-B1]